MSAEIKLCNRLLCLHRVQKLLQQLLSVGFVGNRLSHFIEPRLDRFITADQPIVSLGIFILVESRPGVLCHAPFHQPHHNLQFFLQFCLTLFQFCAVAQHDNDHPRIGGQLISL